MSDHYHHHHHNHKSYGCMAFLLDVVLFCCTGGLWGIWIFVREMRKR